MGIVKSFNNTAIRKPGAYSYSTQGNAAGAQLGTLDTIMLVGESSAGAPGSAEGIQTFAAEQLSQLVAKYGSGPLVDCAIAAVRPSKQAGIGGAGQVLVWKTNAALDAQLVVNETTNTNPLFVISDLGWGTGGNALSVTMAEGDSANQVDVTVNLLNQPAEVLGENSATPVISLHYTGNGSAATGAIGGSTVANKTLTTVLTAQTDSSLPLSIVLSQYTVMQLVSYLNLQPGYVAVLLDATKASNPATDLDSIAATDIKTAALNLYRLQQEILAVINTSQRVSAVLAATPRIGIPNLVTNASLTGGATGASANSDFATGMAKSLSKTYSELLPCISQDATTDIGQGLTDPSSTYTIAAVQAAEVAHLVLRGSIKNRKEAQGWSGYRNAAKASVYTEAQNIGSELVQMTLDDVLVLDQNSNLTWKYPHVTAALMAGIRLGTVIGEPLTHKFINANGFGHYVNPVTGIASGDFDPDIDGDDAIDAGVTYVESAPGGIRIVVDNTTYGIDQSFIFNRGSVVEAAQYIALTVRQTAEQAFVGKKLGNNAATSLKKIIRDLLVQLNAPDTNITTSSADAPQGFVEQTFVVTIQGNTAYVAVEVKPVQGLDFIFITFTLGDITQTA